MRKILLFTALLAFNAHAQTPFRSIQEAEQYCPAINALTFTPNNSHVTYSAGTVTGMHDTIAFESMPPKQSLYPKSLSKQNIIQDAKFREVAGIYGYFNRVATCFYSYAGFNDTAVGLVLRGK